MDKDPSRPKKSNGKYVTTRSGRTLKVNRNLGEKWTAMKEGKAYRKVMRMEGLPKSRLKRILWRLNPKRLYHYWFSRDGGITALKILGLVILAIFVLTLGVFAYFRKDLPNIKDISGDTLGGSISYYDRTGKILLWQDYNAVKRVPVQNDQISPYIKQATVSVEDRDFYKHRGFDVKGITRAASNDVLHHGAQQGGSTITQQLVKLTQDFNQNRSVALKIKELILAVELERTYTKDDILTGYLNAAPYGGVDYGVQSAAADYFHTSAKDLTLPQAAMLAAIPKSPAYYSPYDVATFDKKAFIDRYNYVLDSMVQTHKITAKQAADAKKVDILATVQPQQTKYAGIQAPYFVLAAKNQITTEFASQSGGASSQKVGGWRVITTLDMNLQKKAEDLVQSNIANIKRYGADEEALVLQDVKTGQYQALVGGTDFSNEDHGKINYAQWYISPGSSFKPYDYAALIDKSNNVGAGSVLYDVQQPLPGYPCTNKEKPSFSATSTGGNCLWDYDFKYPGAETLRYALGGSRNVPAVKSMLTVGTDKVIKMADDMMNANDAYKCFNPGVDVNTATKKDRAQCYGASSIGDGSYLQLDQHVNGLASMARLGQTIKPTYIMQIYQGTSKKPSYEWKQPKGTQVIRPESAYIINNMASDPNASYLPAGYYKWHHYNGWTNAIKTGTTNNGFDGLMMSWNTKYAVGSWVGNHTRNVSLHTSMEYLTTPLTRGMMTYALDNSHATPVSWSEPAGLQHLPGYVIRSHVGIGSVEPSPTTEIFPSWYKAKAVSSQNSTIDKISNKLATQCTPTLAKQTVGGSSAPNQYSVDIFYPPGQTANNNSANTGASDDVHSCSDSPPKIDSFFINGQDVSGGGTASCSGSCTITTTVEAGTHPFNDSQYSQYPGTVNLLINGQVAQTAHVSDPSDTKTFTYSGSGSVSVAIQVIDSVLYDSTSASATANFSAQAKALKFESAKQTGATTTVKWKDGSGTVTVTNGGAPVCTAPASDGTCSGSGAPKNSTVTITDTAGGSDTGKVD